MIVSPIIKFLPRVRCNEPFVNTSSPLGRMSAYAAQEGSLPIGPEPCSLPAACTLDAYSNERPS
jgi:hypothetical protein